MSLRPAQDLVAESSKFSLRQFFETAPSPSAPVEATAEAMLPASGGLSHGEAVQSPPLHAMHLGGIPRASAPTSTSPREHKFTFNGLMPSTTPLQMQHRLLQQHQQIALQSGVAKTATSPPVSDASELLRLILIVELVVNCVQLTWYTCAYFLAYSYGEPRALEVKFRYLDWVFTTPVRTKIARVGVEKLLCTERGRQLQSALLGWGGAAPARAIETNSS